MRYRAKDKTITNRNVLIMKPDDFSYLFGMTPKGFHHDIGTVLENTWFPIEMVIRSPNAFYAQFAVVLKPVVLIT